jgi:hypothetical protein
MNERIRELTKQAGISILYEYDGYDGHAAVANLADIEKFAELIVRECLAIAKNREDELESAGLLSESNAVGNVSYRISRQFGVKR